MRNIKKSIKLFSIIITTFFAIVVCACLLLNTVNVSAEEEIDTIKEQFLTNNIDIEECRYSVEDNVLSVTMASDTTSDVINASDITTLRKSRNAMRYSLNKLRIVSTTATYNEVLKNSNGRTLMNSDIYLTELPEFEECKKLLGNIGIENSNLTSTSMFTDLPVGKVEYECKYEPNIGNVLCVTLNSDGDAYSQVNEQIANIMYDIDMYNNDYYSIQQVNLQVLDNNQQIVYMEADLVYRDFLWWQIPEMEDSWTSY